MKKLIKNGYGNKTQGHMVGNVSEACVDFGLRFTSREKEGLYLPKWTRSNQSYPGYHKESRNLLSNRPRLKDK